MNLKTALLLIILSFCRGHAQEIDNWGSWQPLTSSRNTLERKLGPAKNGNCTICSYEDSNMQILVNYASLPCEGPLLSGWRVKPDTVLSYSVTPHTKKLFSELKVDVGDFLTFTDDGGNGYYVNQETGIAYEVSPLGFLNRIIHLPRTSDNALRCKGFAGYNPIGVLYPPTQRIGSFDLQMAKSVLDDLTARVLRGPNAFKIYVIGYYDSKVSKKMLNNFLKKATERVLGVRNIPRDAIKTVNGGRSEKFRLDIFVIAKEYPPPVPSPY